MSVTTPCWRGYCLGAALLLLLLLSAIAEGQQANANNKVSAKLDFDEMDNSTNVPVVTGRGAVDQHNNNNNNSNDSSNAGAGSRSNSNNNNDDGKSRPKIHGVRVTVDTGDADKTKESKESVELSGDGKHRKRVGIHTDITFEISGADIDDDHHNATSSRSGDDKEDDASVPIFKGRGNSANKPRKSSPHDSRHNWSPNFSGERRSYEPARSRPGYYPPVYYPQYSGNHVPTYAAGSDDGRAQRRHDGGWVSYTVPRAGGSSYWTTERPSYADAYRPNTVPGYQQTSGWKPCYCVAQPDQRQRRDSGAVYATGPVMQVVDGKLEQPFSRK